MKSELERLNPFNKLEEKEDHESLSESPEVSYSEDREERSEKAHSFRLPKGGFEVLTERRSGVLYPIQHKRETRPSRVWFYALIGVFIITVLTLFSLPIIEKSRKIQVPTADLTYSENVCTLYTQLELECEVEFVYSSTPKGSLISQSLTAGAKVKRGRLITLYYSGGERLLKVPDLIGMTVKEAESEIRDIRLAFGGIIEVGWDAANKGRVVSSSIPAGTTVVSGTKLFIRVPSSDFIMPDWVGEEGSQVVDEIEREGLEVLIVNEFSDHAPEGVIISQNPHAGEKVKDKIKLVISKGTESIELRVPDLIGETLAEAEETLALKGFKKVRIIEVVDETLNTPEITETIPKTGESCRSDEEITLVLSKPD